MTEAKRRLRVCLLCVVLLAIVVGMFYYYYEANVSETISEGTLVKESNPVVARLWR